MSDLVPYTENLPAIAMDEKALATLATQSSFIPRLQLVTKGHYVELGKIKPGRYGVPQQGGDEIVDLGESIDILPLNVRMKAIDMNDKDNIIASYDRESDEFKRIEEASKESNSQCMWGPTFLVFERNSATFYELFFGNVSARVVAPALVAFLPVSQEKAERLGVEAHGPLPATLSVRYIKKPTFGWHVPVVSKCSEPFTNLPSLDIAKATVEKFISTKSTETVQVKQRDR